ncbi:MAG TPA: MBL fold metallo-hydrolase [Candidatus Atribacteria bacterium]|nr:MBL fold metallo-hydrolase [Candidatus Atribacteria bacterium]HPU08547.1 MBL fold metallo-hydrolase [Candidatus Atribacteria bacterium]HQE24728.1 MBL fold metallo-hydrolase [Candidatus Atribacteria bacterium]
MENFIKFLGTAGARVVVSKQLRASGGVWIKYGDTNFHLDPGPGALVKALSSRPRLSPSSLDALLLSHRHLDHSNDLNIMVEAMTEGATRERGAVFLPREALGEEPVLFSYLRDKLENLEILEEGGQYQWKDISFSTPLRHLHSAETYGFRFIFPQGDVSFITDSLFDEKLIEAYKDSKILVINTVRLHREVHPHILHLSIPDAQVLVENIKPRLAFLTHFGLTVLREKPWEIAEEMSQKTGIKVIAANDGMKIDLEEALED